MSPAAEIISPFPYVRSRVRTKITGEQLFWPSGLEGLRLLSYQLQREEVNFRYLDARRHFINWAVQIYGTIDDYESHFSSA